VRGFNCANLGSPLIHQQYGESYSPFCDVDVLDYVLHVPTVKRRNYYFYDRWILSCYPEAAQWHHKHAQIGHRAAMVTVGGRNIPLRDVPKRIIMSLLKRLHIYDAYREEGESMHPYETWLKQNPQIADTIRHYYETHKHLLNGSLFRAQCEEKMRMGSMMEKGKVLTILSALQAFADNGE
jgi:asparagine synthase (glutamine-hydrolysing)